jgi:hypothetical protein
MFILVSLQAELPLGTARRTIGLDLSQDVIFYLPKAETKAPK